ncbi:MULTISPECIES: hypothetical protein [unclassified Bradyrhizobium]|nr:MULTISPECIES: hypothetical protein [unclassified Bradyrhizobium]
MSDQFRMLSWRIGAPLEELPPKDDPNTAVIRLIEDPARAHRR